MARYLVIFHPGDTVPDRIKYVDDATAAPDANDDAATLGVTLGSVWIDTTNDDAWICVDSTTAAAVWKQIGGDSGGTLHTDLSVSGAHAIDRGDGETHDLTLTGNATFTLAGALTGQATDIRVILRQDGTGSHTVTWPTITWAGGSAPTLQTAANAVDTIGLLTVDDGVTWFGYFNEDHTLDDLTDVAITAAAAGDFLRHDGAAWVDATITEADVPVLTSAKYPFHDEVLTDGSSNIIYAGGDVVMVTGVPN